MGGAPPQLPPEGFIQLSRQHFGTADYGLSIVNLLHHLRMFGDKPEALPPHFQTCELVTGPITEDTMAQYVETNGLAEHELGGTLGKMIDLMGLASRVMRAPRTIDLPKAAFISRQSLVAQTKADYPMDRMDGIRLAINANVQQQLRTGQPGPGGAIIIEGRTRFIRTPFNTIFQSIASKTLPCLIDEIPPRYGESARQFLRQFDRNLE